MVTSKLKKFSLIFFLLAACTLFSNDLVSFKGHKITSQDFKKAVERLGPQGERIKSDPMMRERFLDHLINQKLISEKAIADKFDQSNEFKDKMDSIKDEILTSTYLEHYIQRETSDAKAKEYFEKNPQMFSKEEVHAHHILIKEEKEAEKILKEVLKPGADFAALAKKHSIDPGASNGGDLGFFPRGAMVPAFEEAAFKTEKGTIHPTLVKTQFGYHIIKVADKKGDNEKADFAKVKDEVINRMKRDLSMGLIEDLRKVADVKINDKKLKELKF